MAKTYVYNEKLKYARELRGWSQEELARRIGCLAESMGHQGVVLDVSTISRWERGRNSPIPFYRQLLCSLFEMNAEELGLLPPDNSPLENTISLHEFGSPENGFERNTLPITYDRGMLASIAPGSLQPDLDTIDAPLHYVEQDATYQDLHTVETPSSDPAPRSPFMSRRNLLIALLASTTVGAGAAATKLLLFRPAPTISRHWPKVTPDIHKKLARVRVIQRMINAHSGHVTIDGIFWVETENAVMLFQENTHLPVTGTVTSSTWEHLILPSGITDNQMNQGSQVKALQEILNGYGASPRLEVDGTFGPLTEAATRHFQQTHHLATTGQADLNTWCVLVGGYLK